jgi:hypothetical protein
MRGENTEMIIIAMYFKKMVHNDFVFDPSLVKINGLISETRCIALSKVVSKKI